MKITLPCMGLLVCCLVNTTYAIESSPVNSSVSVVNSQSAKINLNQADVATLIRSFKGIGKKRAQAIVHYRESSGPFKSIEELADVTGFGHIFVSKHLYELQQVFSVE